MTNSKYITIDKKNNVKVKIGNHKIGFDTLIFSLSSATHCVNNLNGTCPYGKYGNNKCYALKDERIYSKKDIDGNSIIVKAKDNQGKYWRSHNKEELLNTFKPIIEKYKLKYFRLNESGDLSTKKDLEKLIYLANNLNITIYTYTHSKKLIAENKELLKNKPNNLIINGSEFMLDNNFTVIQKNETKPNMLLCKMNCSICNYCKTGGHKTICVIQH